MATPKIGDGVVYVDAVGQEHKALVTNEFSGGNTEGDWSINVLYVNPDETMNDGYGRQILRETSVVAKAHQSAHGRYYYVPE